jgi:hypothetical protein
VVVAFANVTVLVVAPVTKNVPLYPATLIPVTRTYDPTGNGFTVCVANVNRTEPTAGVLGVIAVTVSGGPMLLCN